jgi:hypothetical protein
LKHNGFDGRETIYSRAFCTAALQLPQGGKCGARIVARLSFPCPERGLELSTGFLAPGAIFND